MNEKPEKITRTDIILMRVATIFFALVIALLLVICGINLHYAATHEGLTPRAFASCAAPLAFAAMSASAIWSIRREFSRELDRQR